MQISKLQATALQFFIATSNITNIVEVGTFVGFSAFSMAKILDSVNGKLTTIEINKDFHTQAERNKDEYMRAFRDGKKVSVGGIERIEFINDDAKRYFQELIKTSSEIDMIFLDGDKENYGYYLDWSLKYLRPGSYLLIDNALFKGGVVSETGLYATSIREMTRNLKKSKQFDYFFLPVGDCMIVARKR